jgi:putative SOS response-associated peptidase YedK
MPPASGEFHDRLWLDPEVHDPKLLEPLLRPYPSEELVVHPVTNLVNNPRNENPGCVEPLT